MCIDKEREKRNRNSEINFHSSRIIFSKKAIKEIDGNAAEFKHKYLDMELSH